MIDYKDVIEIKKALKRGIKPMMYGDTVFDERAVLIIEDVYDVPMGYQLLVMNPSTGNHFVLEGYKNSKREGSLFPCSLTCKKQCFPKRKKRKDDEY